MLEAARWAARRLLRENAIELFRLEGLLQDYNSILLWGEVERLFSSISIFLALRLVVYGVICETSLTTDSFSVQETAFAFSVQT